jgi:hypothetical protein
MLDCSPSGKSSDYMDLILLDKIQVDLCDGILTRAHYDGRLVLPQKNILLILRQMRQYIFFQCQVKVRVGGFISYINHLFWSPKMSKFYVYFLPEGSQGFPLSGSPERNLPFFPLHNTPADLRQHN